MALIMPLYSGLARSAQVRGTFLTTLVFTTIAGTPVTRAASSAVGA